tara:strand:- start:76 stop:2013 length:1938 start_codon:yes stop_codon:yes gene_type:complete
MRTLNMMVILIILCAVIPASSTVGGREVGSADADGDGANAAGRAQDLSMTIVKDGKPAATIVTVSDSVETKGAVKDLQAYIEKMSGAKLPIASSATTAGNLILVGRMPAVDKLIPDLDKYDLGPDGFVIRMLPGKLIVTGKTDGFIHPSLGRFRGPTDCGTPNAVYSFLESLGCRWYMPGEDGEIVPRKRTITVPAVDLTSKPDFAGRWIGIHTRTGQAYEDFLLWRARNRISHNTYFHMHAVLAGAFPDAESHPEYFALVNGERKMGGAPAVCFSNPDVIRILSGNLVRKLTEQPPFWRAYTVGQADGGSDGWCQCENCLALYGDKMFTYPTTQQARVVGRGPSDEPTFNVANGYLGMVNAIAERAEQVNPDLLLTYYAHYNIPGMPTVKPRDSVLPVICHIAPSNEHWRRQVLHWVEISKQLYYYTYMGYRLDFPQFEIVDNIRWCHEHKGIAMYLEHDAFTPVNLVAMYLASKTMWDIDVDSEKMLTEFYTNFFGAGADPMRQFFETFHRLTKGANFGYDYATEYPDTLNAEAVATCRSYIAEARRRATRPVVKRRLESFSRYWRATELHVAAQDSMAKWKKDKTDENMKATRRALADTIGYINSVADEFNLQGRIALLSHEGYNPDLEELNQWDKAQAQRR